MLNRNRFVLLMSFLPGLLTSAGSLVISGLPKRGFAAVSSEASALTVKDWTAAGSGCRAHMNKGGDVELVSLQSLTVRADASELTAAKPRFGRPDITSEPALVRSPGRKLMSRTKRLRFNMGRPPVKQTNY